MAQVKPFRALRFTKQAGEISSLCCPPYDIISEEQRQGYLATNPLNVIRLELPREGADPYAAAGEVLNRWLAEGVLALEDAPAIYVYGESFAVDGVEYSFKGFISRVKLEPFSAGVVLPHEETLSKAKADRFDLMCATGCNFSQIYSLYMDEDGSRRAMVEQMSQGAPDARFTDADGVTHSLWVCKDADKNAALCAAFADRKLYIADGHHRYETGLNYLEHCKKTGKYTHGCDSIMMMLVDMQNPGLVVFPTHRIIKKVEGFSSETLLENCAEDFDIFPAEDLAAAGALLKEAYAAGKKAFGYFDGSAYCVLQLKNIAVMDEILPNVSDALRRLDVSVLHALVLERILGIDKENMAKQINLSYTRDAAEAVAEVEAGQANCAFFLNPTRVSEIAAVATAGEKMPQKSTYFYPKLITGLVMNQISTEEK